jgi:hypothetical protein
MRNICIFLHNVTANQIFIFIYFCFFIFFYPTAAARIKTKKPPRNHAPNITPYGVRTKSRTSHFFVFCTGFWRTWEKTDEREKKTWNKREKKILLIIWFVRIPYKIPYNTRSYDPAASTHKKSIAYSIIYGISYYEYWSLFINI